jgi:hypothetical protein
MNVFTGEAMIPKATLKALIEVTGQPELDMAIRVMLRDAIEHRLEKVRGLLGVYEEKYGVTFEEFEAKGKSGELSDRFSQQIEEDYFEWDSLVTRQRKLGEISQWLA